MSPLQLVDCVRHGHAFDLGERVDERPRQRRLITSPSTIQRDGERDSDGGEHPVARILAEPASAWQNPTQIAVGETLRLHDLRVTLASRLAANNVDVPTAQAILRHANPSTTLNL
jgi:integrase